MFSALFYSFIFITIIQFFYFFIVFSKFSFLKPKKYTTKNISVSVIVCAKNEAENLKKLIPKLLEQDYKNFELVLIDDCSIDETIEIFENYEKQFSNIKIVRVEKNETFWGNKKFALTLGIKAASNDYLLFIDADCVPNSNQWITEMVGQFNNEKNIVLGYGAYQKIPNSFLNKIIRFDTLFTALQYFSWAKFGNPYMGVGRNLAYKKSEFYRVNGFINHMKVLSGDDDLFINEAATNSNTAICFSANSFTISKPKTTFPEWFFQKRRHIISSKYYKFFDKAQLSLFFISQFLFITLATILLISNYQFIIVLFMIIFRYIFSWIIVSNAANKLNETDLILWFPILEIILIITQLRLFFANIISKPRYWK